MSTGRACAGLRDRRGRGRGRGPGAALLAAALGLAAGAGGCEANRQPGDVQFTLIQLSELSGLRPPAPGRPSRLARVAGLRQPGDDSTFVTLSGDLFSPSPTNGLEYLGEPFDGKPMVAVMNALRLDYATFGNHEFDLDENRFYRRLAESKTRWISTNVTDPAGRPFARVPRSFIFRVDDGRHPSLRVALLGMTADADRTVPYVRFLDPVGAARREIARLAGRYDVLIALTHLEPADEKRLARDVPEINLILGGEAIEPQAPEADGRRAPIARSAPDARAVWVHRLNFHTETRRLVIKSTLVDLDDAATPPAPPIRPEAAVESEINAWLAKSSRPFLLKTGREMNELIATLPEGKTIEGRESFVRRGPTNLTRLVAEAMLMGLDARMAEDPQDMDDLPRLALFNSGLLRLDDRLAPGPVTAYDIYRIFPFRGDKIRAVRFPGKALRALLARSELLLKQGEADKVNHGSFLLAYDRNGRVTSDSSSIDGDGPFLVAVNEYLADGREAAFRDSGLENLQRVHEDLGQWDLHWALISRFKNTKLGFPDDDDRAAPAEPKAPAAGHVEFVVPRPGGPAPAAAEPAKVDLIRELCAAMEQEGDDRTKLDLARALIRVDPSSDAAAGVLVAGLRSRRAEVNAKARRFLPELLPAAPPALLRKLTPLLNDRDRFLREDVAEMLSLVDRRALQPRPEGDAKADADPRP